MSCSMKHKNTKEMAYLTAYPPPRFFLHVLAAASNSNNTTMRATANGSRTAAIISSKLSIWVKNRYTHLPHIHTHMLNIVHTFI